MKELARIQKDLKAPKGQYNSFGKYKYRSCEDILEAVKPLLGDCILTLSDEIVMICSDRIYVKATATIQCGDEQKSTYAFAREPLDKKGMDDSQITGTASSYARKYALNGLFLIDDTKDADTDEHQKQSEKKDWMSKGNVDNLIKAILKAIQQGQIGCPSADDAVRIAKEKYLVGAETEELLRSEFSKHIL